jgi:hypothetical protein
MVGGGKVVGRTLKGGERAGDHEIRGTTLLVGLF